VLPAPHKATYGSPRRTRNLHDGDRDEHDAGEDCGCNRHADRRRCDAFVAACQDAGAVSAGTHVTIGAGKHS
jgi:hypothetical protein